MKNRQTEAPGAFQFYAMPISLAETGSFTCCLTALNTDKSTIYDKGAEQRSTCQELSVFNMTLITICSGQIGTQVKTTIKAF